MPMMKSESSPIFRSAARLKAWIDERGPGRVVLANGCFDPLHVGHIRYLYGAKSHGDFLVVAINDDESTRALKGKRRPIMPAVHRSRLVAALEMVDAVLIFSGRDVVRILRSIRPSCHAKGTDYTVETVPEREFSKSLGIETVVVGDPKSHASSEVVERVRSCKGRGKAAKV
jgi:rfaE bifunctional protein nucleotidyltransferase chain/domain